MPSIGGFKLGDILPLLLSLGEAGVQQDQFNTALGLNRDITAKQLEAIFGKALSEGAYLNRANDATLGSLYEKAVLGDQLLSSGYSNLLGTTIGPAPLSDSVLGNLRMATNVPNVPSFQEAASDRVGRGASATVDRASQPGGVRLVGEGARPREPAVQKLDDLRVAARDVEFNPQRAPGPATWTLEMVRTAARQARQAGLTDMDSEEKIIALLSQSGAQIDRDVANWAERYQTTAQGLNFASRLATVMGMIQGIGTQESRDISQRYRGVESDITQNLLNQGLYSSSVQASLAPGVAREETNAQRRLTESVAQMQANAFSGLSGDYLAARERALQSQYANQQSGMGALTAASNDAINRNLGLFGNNVQLYLAALDQNRVVGPSQPNPFTFAQSGLAGMRANQANRAQIEAMNPQWYESVLPSLAGGIGAGVGLGLGDAAYNVTDTLLDTVMGV